MFSHLVLIMSRAPREVFPLPRSGAVRSDFRAGIGSRRSRQRVGRRDAVDRRVDDLVWSLNELYHCGSFGGPRTSQAQNKILSRLRDVVLDDTPPVGLDPQAALRELLGKEPGYSDGCSINVVPFCQADLSLPDCAGRACLVDCLPPHLRLPLTDPVTHLLTSSSSSSSSSPPPYFKKVRAYWDPVLRDDDSA